MNSPVRAEGLKSRVYKRKERKKGEGGEEERQGDEFNEVYPVIVPARDSVIACKFHSPSSSLPIMA